MPEDLGGITMTNHSMPRVDSHREIKFGCLLYSFSELGKNSKKLQMQLQMQLDGIDQYIWPGGCEKSLLTNIIFDVLYRERGRRYLKIQTVLPSNEYRRTEAILLQILLG